MSQSDGSNDAAGPDECVETDQEDDKESFSFDDELDEAFGVPKSIFVGGGYAATVGGLPEQVDPNDVADAHAPPFLRSNQCCIADRSEYVVRDVHGQVTATYPPSDVERSPDGRYRLKLQEMVEVLPKRPECVHLVRQLVPPTASQRAAGTVRYGWMRRYCSARRSTGGAFLDLTDQEMGACSMRSPFDLETTTRLDEFDDRSEQRSAGRELVNMFNLTSERLLPAPAAVEGKTDP